MQSFFPLHCLLFLFLFTFFKWVLGVSMANIAIFSPFHCYLFLFDFFPHFSNESWAKRRKFHHSYPLHCRALPQGTQKAFKCLFLYQDPKLALPSPLLHSLFSLSKPIQFWLLFFTCGHLHPIGSLASKTSKITSAASTTYK